MGIWLLIDYSYQLWTLNIDHNLCYFVAEYAVFMQKMLFVAVLLCDFYANCADIMQIVLFLCKLWGFYANSAVLMQIVLFWCKLSHLSQFTLFCRKWHFCRKIRALAGTFGSAIRRRLLLMMSGISDGMPHRWIGQVSSFFFQAGGTTVYTGTRHWRESKK